jgi:hypothetical protein
MKDNSVDCIIHLRKKGENMKKVFKLIIGLLVALGAAGLAYSIAKAVQIKNEDNDFDGDNEFYTQVKCVFDGIEEQIDVSDKKLVSLRCHFGGMELTFNESSSSNDELFVDLDVSFGGIRLHVPRTWDIVFETNCIMGGVDSDARLPLENSSKLILTGKILFGGVEVLYLDDEDDTTED